MTRMAIAVSAVVLTVSSLAGCGSDRSESTWTSPSEEYRENVFHTLSRAPGLTLESADCVSKGIFSTYSVGELESEDRNDLYFISADELDFGSLVEARPEAGQRILDILSGCEVDLKEAAMAMYLRRDTAKARRCAEKSLAPEQLHNHFRDVISGSSTLDSSDVFKVLAGKCSGGSAPTPEPVPLDNPSTSSSSPGGIASAALMDTADSLASLHGYTLRSSAAGEGAMLAEVTCERATGGWDYDTAVADDISAGAPEEDAIGWNTFVYQKYCPAVR